MAENFKIGQLKGFLTQMVELRRSCTFPPEFHYVSGEDVVLQEGRVFAGRELPDNSLAGLPRNCFLNCIQLATAEPDRFTYVEGYAAGLIPVHHAWLIDEHGLLVDPTWEDSAECTYMGVPFPLELVRDQHQDRQFVSLLDNFEQGHPLLRKPLAATLADYQEESGPRERSELREEAFTLG